MKFWAAGGGGGRLGGRRIRPYKQSLALLKKPSGNRIRGFHQ